jgi:hypothetical protein
MDFGPYGNSWWSKKWLETLLEGASEQASLFRKTRRFGRV